MSHAQRLPISSLAAQSKIRFQLLCRTLPLCLLGTLLSGCGSSPVAVPGPIPIPVPVPVPVPLVPGSAFAGSVHSGLHPIAGASVMLYAVGATGYGSPGSALLKAAVQSDAAGKFNIAGDYFCPSIGSGFGPSTPVYLLASGGNPGLATGKANAASLLVAGLGPCNALTTTFEVAVNEVSTVGAAWALAPFFSVGANIGSSPGNSLGIAHAFATLTNLVDPVHGSSPGAAMAANVTVPAAKINALANILAACVGSDGSTGCAALFAASTTPEGTIPSNTADAAWNIVRQPGSNVALLFSQISPLPPFQPSLLVAPADWTLDVKITGGGMISPTALSVDSAGNVWVANYDPVVSEFTHLGAPVAANGLTGNGIDGAYGITIDANDNIWIPNYQSSSNINAGKGSLTELTAAGQPLSGHDGYTLGGLVSPIAMAADPNGNVWAVNQYNATATLYEHPASGVTAVSVSAPGKLGFPTAIAIDGGHNAWVTAHDTPAVVTRISADTTQVTTYVCCDDPAGVAVDQAGNIWVANFHGSSLSELSNTGTVLLNGRTGGGLAKPLGIAIDGKGTVWLANEVTPSGGLSEFSGSLSAAPGTPLSPSGGLGGDAALTQAYGIALDDSGDIWISSFNGQYLVEFVGLAAPVKTPVVGPSQLP